MSAVTLSEEQTKLLRLCLKHAEPIKPNWEKVAKEAELVSTSAASQRWGRLYKILIGDQPSSSPGKGKATTKPAGGATTPKKATSKKATSPIMTKASADELDNGVNSDPEAEAEATTVTPKKRVHDKGLGSDIEDGTSPSKVMKTEVKFEE